METTGTGITVLTFLGNREFFLDKTLLLTVVSMSGVAVMSRNALVGIVVGRIADMPVMGSVDGNRNPIVMVVRNKRMRQQRADCQQHN